MLKTKDLDPVTQTRMASSYEIGECLYWDREEAHGRVPSEAAQPYSAAAAAQFTYKPMQALAH